MEFTIAADHPCLPGHFPGHPLVPGVVILEQVLVAIAQHTGVEAQRVRLGQVKFIAPLLPGQPATVAVEYTAPRWRFSVSGSGQVLVRGDLQLDGQDTAA